MAVLSEIEEQSSQFKPGQPDPPKRWTGARKAIAVAISLLLMIMILQVANSQGLLSLPGDYTPTYSWSFMGNNLTFTEIIPNSAYDHYRSQPKTYDFASYVTKNDPIVERLAEGLKGEADQNGYNTAQFILSFVQNIPYGTDENTTGTANYPRYPVETLVDGIGDCKDHSTLFVSLMESPAVNADMVLLWVIPATGDNHLAAGIAAGEYGNNYPSLTSFQYHWTNYYYCETTSPGWMIGEMPLQFEGYQVQVLPC